MAPFLMCSIMDSYTYHRMTETHKSPNVNYPFCRQRWDIGSTNVQKILIFSVCCTASEQRNHYKYLWTSFHLTFLITAVFHFRNVQCTTSYSSSSEWDCPASFMKGLLCFIRGRAATPCNCFGSLCLFICYAPGICAVLAARQTGAASASRRGVLR